MTVFKKYFLPWSYLCIAFVFVFSMVHADERAFQVGLLNAIVCAVTLIGGFFLCQFIFVNILQKKDIVYTELDVEKLLVYSFTIVFLLKIITAVFPSLFFVQILMICTGFIVWDGAKALFDTTEENRSFVAVSATLLIILTPAIVTFLLRLMIPII